MHTVELLELALQAVQGAGYRIRRDLLAGQGGGACTIRGQKWLFLDLGTDCTEQLGEVLEILREDPVMDTMKLPDELTILLDRRRAA